MAVMTREQELHRAERARQIMDDPLFSSAVHDIREALLVGIQRSAFTDEKLREKLCQRFALLEDLLSMFKTHMETGQLAKMQLEFDKEQKSRIQQFRELIGY